MRQNWSLALALGMALALQPLCSSAAPSTATFMNAMTVCGAGSTVSINAQLRGSIVSLYEKDATDGRAIQEIVTGISKLLPQGDAYRLYLDCVQKLLLSPG